MAAAATSRRLSAAAVKHPHRTKAVAQNSKGQKIEIEVDSFDTDMMLDITMWAVHGESLLRFLQDDAHEYFREEIALRFAYEGDSKSGNWGPLHDATVDIRRALGYGGETPINVRTGDLFDFVTRSYDVMGGEDWAMLTLPGDPPNPTVAQKLKTAQQGSSNNPLGYGPTMPRPVLALGESDMVVLLQRLQSHIMMQIVGLVS
jgi:hypothetical protein